ncbi:MAG: hypothetical protein ACK4UO_11425 [Pseudolabrys sp.]
MEQDRPSSDETPQVVHIHRGRPTPRPPGQPVEDLARYERGPDGPDDYRHRMLVNVVAFLFVIALIGAGLWIADTMAKMRKNQDCVLTGRRGCTPVEATSDRW